MVAMNKKINIEELAKLSLKELKEVYVKEFDTKPPRGRSLIERALAQKIQEKKYGKLKSKHKKVLKESLGPRVKKKFNYNLKEGQEIVKEYLGKTYSVKVLAKGFSFKNKEYRSLSQIAKLITGNHISGPLFFKLRKREDG